jgi:NAD(P)-dependent dehydrogenase (short-subunit alcohol dehydrogenase family)
MVLGRERARVAVGYGNNRIGADRVVAELASLGAEAVPVHGWGRVVHISTGLVEDDLAGSATYTTPKAGLRGLTRTAT